MSLKEKSKITRKEKFQYYFENTIAKGPTGVIKWLALITLFSVLVMGLLIMIFGLSDTPENNEGLGFVEGLWQSLMSTIDPGNLGGDSVWSYRAVRLIATLIGIFITSILIGTISSGIDGKIEELKRGRSKVIEKNHTLILGWSEKIFSIISELVIANENQKKPCIVILSEKDKVEAEEDLRSKIENFRNTKVVVRSGSPLDSSDLYIVNPNEARSIIVLSPDLENADVHVIKTVLGLTKGKNRKEGELNIVAEIKDEKNMEAAELVGNDEAIFILSADIISRITAQTCLQSGLSVVYSELLCFDGDEMYFKEESSLVGKTFKETLIAFNTSSVIGIYTSENEALINPPMDYVIKENDQIIAISEDDDTIVLDGKKEINVNSILSDLNIEHEIKVARSLILGWNVNGAKIIRELDNYVATGSIVTIMADFQESDVELIEDVKANLGNIKLNVIKGEISDKKTLLSLNPEIFTNIIVLSYKHLNVQESDAKTLICLLHLRNISEHHNQNFNIVTEMLDLKNRELGVVARADDFIVGDNLISLLLSQLSENRDLKKVYDELFKSDGSEIYLKPASRYIKLGETVDFYTILINAAALNETAFGYRISKHGSDIEHNFGVKINPNKDEKITLNEEDYVIVLSED